MDIAINGKKFILNDDVRLGILIQVDKDPNNLDTIFAFFREILIPSPTNKEIENFRQSDMNKIFAKWKELQDEQVSETKKKLSQ